MSVKHIMLATVLSSAAHLSQASCTPGGQSCPLDIKSAPPWKSSSYYNTDMTVAACSGNMSFCVNQFESWYASGLICSALPMAIPSGAFVGVATVSFIAAVLAMCAPWSPTFLCGKITPHAMVAAMNTLFVALLVRAAILMRAEQEAAVLTVEWGATQMASALHAFCQSSAQNAHILLMTSVSVPYMWLDITGGMATGPIGLVIVSIVVAIMVCRSKSGSNSSNSSSSNSSCCCGGGSTAVTPYHGGGGSSFYFNYMMWSYWLYGPPYWSPYYRPYGYYYTSPTPVYGNGAGVAVDTGAVVYAEENGDKMRAQAPVVYENPYKWNECGIAVAIQIIVAIVLSVVIVVSWKTTDCIRLSTP